MYVLMSIKKEFDQGVKMITILGKTLLQKTTYFSHIVKERFEGTNTLSELLTLLLDHLNYEIDKETLISEVKELFIDHPDLFSGFCKFVVVPEKTDDFLKKKTHKKSMKVCIDYINQVRLTLQDHDYKTFLNIITDFKVHNDINRVLKEAIPLFKNHQELFLQLSWFLMEHIELKSNETMPLERKRKPDQYEETILRCEDDLFETGVSFYSTLSVKTAAERLVAENVNRDSEEEMDVGEYLSRVNFEFLREMYGDKFFPSRLMVRGKAIKDSTDVASHMEENLEKLKSSLIRAEEKWDKAFSDYYEKEQRTQYVFPVKKGKTMI